MTYDPNRDIASRRDAGMWGWIIGIAAIVVLGFIVWAAVGNNSEVAQTDPPATQQRETTGAAPGAAPPRPSPAPPARTAPPANNAPPAGNIAPGGANQ